MIPERIYENLPYLYMGAGVLTLATVVNYFGLLSGALLFMAGALTWILRSDNRRADKKTVVNKPKVLPHWFYEIQPFVYFVTGISLWLHSQNMFLYPSALILCVVGAQVWYLRTSQRRHNTPSRIRSAI